MERVAPLIPFLHKKIVQEQFSAAEPKQDPLDNESEALVFALYLVTFTSLKDAECEARFRNRTRNSMIKRYRYATEQAIKKATLENRQSLKLIQACVLLAVSGWREGGSDYVYGLIHWALQFAERISLDQDGLSLGLDFFESEMRRRLWWEICVLDTRSTEDMGCDFQVYSSNVLPPINTDDAFFYDDMLELQPEEQLGVTGMTFSIIRVHISIALRNLRSLGPFGRFQAQNNLEFIFDCGLILLAIHQDIEANYVSQCRLETPLDWFIATVSRVILFKAWSMVHMPFLENNTFHPWIADKLREELFIRSIEVIQFTHLIDLEDMVAPFAWMNSAHLPLHTLKFVAKKLSECLASDIPKTVWDDVVEVHKSMRPKSKYKNEPLWLDIDKYMKIATEIHGQTTEETAEEVTR